MSVVYKDIYIYIRSDSSPIWDIQPSNILGIEVISPIHLKDFTCQMRLVMRQSFIKCQAA